MKSSLNLYFDFYHIYHSGVHHDNLNKYIKLMSHMLQISFHSVLMKSTVYHRILPHLTQHCQTSLHWKCFKNRFLLIFEVTYPRKRHFKKQLASKIASKMYRYIKGRVTSSYLSACLFTTRWINMQYNTLITILL